MGQQHRRAVPLIIPEGPHPTQLRYMSAYEAIQKPDIQHSLAPVGLRPFKSDTPGN